MKRRATAILLISCCTYLTACGDSDKPSATPETPTPSKPLDPNASLPFDPRDESATFTARLLVEDREGAHPQTSLTYGDDTYETDANGKLEIPNVKVSNPEGLRLHADGYLPRSVVLDYTSAGGPDGLRVVLEAPGVVREFASSEPAQVTHGSVQLEFAPNSFANADGTPYDGMVTASALGIDPVASVIEMDADGIAVRPDFDLDRIPQGFGLAIGADDRAHFVMPESVFSVEITGDDGSVLKLQTGAQATYKFKLSGMSTRKAGDVLPTFAFDEVQQRWVESGTCTVQGTPEDMLECVGTTTHFSTWMISSASDKTTPSCGNLQFRVKADADYEAKPVSIKLSKVYGRDSIDTSMKGDTGEPPAMTSTSGLCFYQAQPFAFVRVEVTLRRVKREGGAAVDEKFSYVLGKGAAAASEYDHNLQLVRTGDVTNADLTKSKLDQDCLKCPPSFVDLDLRKLKPADPASTTGCAVTKCGPGAICVGSGTCTCAAGEQYKSEVEGCATASCEAPKTWDATLLACAAVDPCISNNGGCDSHATCTSNAAGAASCACKPGYSGDGQACVVMDSCTEAPCLHGGSCSAAAQGYTCNCAPGWTGTNCETNINECMNTPSPCDAHATCLDTDGSNTCTCNPGYAGTGKPEACTNIDACVNHGCPSGYACTDKAPPALNDENGRTCADIDECAADSGRCGHGTCDNTTGSYTCTCETGYSNASTPGQCADVDACVDHPCESGQTCTDIAAPAPDTSEGRSCSSIQPDVDACSEFPCESGQICTDLASPAPNSSEGRSCSPGEPDVDACIEFPCEGGQICTDLASPAPNSGEGRSCSPGQPDVDACSEFPCESPEVCMDLPDAPNSEEGRTCSPPGGGGNENEADLTSGAASATILPSQPFDDLTRGIAVTYNGSFGFITGIRISGLSEQTEAYVRIYDSSQNLVATGMNTSVTSSSAEVTLTQSYMPTSEPIVIAAWLFGTNSTATLYEPSAFGYDDTSGKFTVTGGLVGEDDAYPAVSSTTIPQLTVLMGSPP